MITYMMLQLEKKKNFHFDGSRTAPNKCLLIELPLTWISHVSTATECTQIK